MKIKPKAKELDKKTKRTFSIIVRTSVPRLFLLTPIHLLSRVLFYLHCVTIFLHFSLIRVPKYSRIFYIIIIICFFPTFSSIQYRISFFLNSVPASYFFILLIFEYYMPRTLVFIPTLRLHL